MCSRALSWPNDPRRGGMTDVVLHSVGRDLTAVSLCTGSGAFDLGLSLAIPRLRPVLYVEREAFAVAHLVAAIEAGAIPAAPIWSDARTIPGRQFRGCVDLLFGGIPCQPFSLAGARAGEADDRNLWPATRRAIVQIRPWCVFIENVGGLLGDPAAYRIFRELRRLGFAVEGGLFTAAEVGATQERERLFILAVREPRPGTGPAVPEPMADPDRQGSQVDPRQPGHPRLQQPTTQRGRRPLGDPAGLRAAAAARTVRAGRAIAARAGDAMGDTYSRRYGRRAPEPQRRAIRRTAAAWTGQGAGFAPGPLSDNDWRRLLAVRPRLEPVVRREADGLADRLDRLRLLGDGVVPLAAAYAFRTLAVRLAAHASPRSSACSDDVMTADLQDLLARVEAATGADRELDILIASGRPATGSRTPSTATTLADVLAMPERREEGMRWEGIPYVTTSSTLPWRW